MSETARQQRQSIKIISEIPSDYHDQRMAAWEKNASLWSRYVERDEHRFNMLDALARRVGDKLRNFEAPKITDFGCGQGEFLMLCHQHVPDGAALTGLDFCQNMLSVAREQSTAVDNIEFRLGDIEDSSLALEPDSDLTTAVLSLDEVSSLDVPFFNIASALRPGGHAMVVILDPVVELMRHRKEVASVVSSDGELVEALLISKHFLVDQRTSPAPYYRVIRPVTNYLRAAARHGLQLIEFEEWPPQAGVGTSVVGPVFNILLFHKATGS